MEPLTRRRYVAAAGTVGLAGTTALAGCLSGDEDDDGDDEDETDSPTDTPDDGFHVQSIDFAATEPAGYDEYTPQPDATYAPGDRVWFYFDVRQVTADDGEVDLTLELTINPPEDSDLEPSNDSRGFTDDFGDQSTIEKVFLTRAFDLNDSVPDGEYVTEATVTDEKAGESDDVSGSFYVES